MNLRDKTKDEEGDEDEDELIPRRERGCLAFVSGSNPVTKWE